MPGRVYRFRGLELDESRFELKRGGGRVEVQPKALDLLLYLLRHRDRVVTKDELLNRLWPDVVVGEASLSKAISTARRAVGDVGREQGCIETVRGRGFRFLAAVEECEAPRDCGLPPGERAPRSEPRPGADSEDPFVGRGQVLDAIAAAVSGVGAGVGRLILLAGRPGMGKTRTAREATLRARNSGTHVLMSWCHEGGGAPELWPWIQLLRQLVAQRDATTLGAGLESGMADLMSLSPALRPHGSPLSPRQQIDPEQARFRLFDTAAQLFERASRDEPYLLVLDDFHWADRASLALLGFVARELGGARLAVLVTYRDEELGPGHLLLELSRRPDCLLLGLAGLDDREVGQLVELETGRPAEPAVVAAIRQHTEGNPFFVKEVVRALAATGDLEAAELPALPLPAGVREVLRQRLDRLSYECREILALCAVIDRELDVGVLARASGVAPARILTLLDEARRGHVVDALDGKYRLSHALVREALSQYIGPADRAALHWRIGEAIEAVHEGDAELHLGELAGHFCAGAAVGGARKAVYYAQRAGDRAAELLAYEEAAKHYQHALEVESFAGDYDSRRKCDLLLALGQAQVASGQSSQGRETLARAAALARQLDGPEAFARAALASGGLVLSTEVGIYDAHLVAMLDEALTRLPEDDSVVRTQLLVRLSLAMLWSPRPERAARFADEAVAAARRHGDPVALAYALYAHRWSLVDPGEELEARLADSNEMLQLARQAGQRELELAGRSCRMLDLVELGRVAEADRDLVAYESLASDLRVPRYLWRARFYRGMRMLLEGRFAESEPLLQQGLSEENRFSPADAGQVFGVQLATIRREQDRLGELETSLAAFADHFPILSGWRAALALLWAELGRDADARDTFESFAVDDFRVVPRNYLRPATLVVLAETCAVLGDARRAATLYDLVHPYAPRNVVIGAGAVCWGAIDRFLGRLAATKGDHRRAVCHFEAALQMDRRTGARPWACWSEYHLAGLLATRGGAHEKRRALDHLKRARQTADALGMARLERQASELAARLG